MKVKYKKFAYGISGIVASYYIKYYKHWWDWGWRIEMDGLKPAEYELINGEFVKKIL